MEYTELHKIPGIMVLIDFEKAFDTLEWQFPRNTLNLSQVWSKPEELDLCDVLRCRKRNNKWRLRYKLF